MEAEKKIKCPVCGNISFEEADDFDICEVCGWENDGLQNRHPEMPGGANRMSLNQAREAWKRGEPIK